MNFYQLHQQQQPLLLANVWDVASAKTAESLGFQAIGTSSLAIASMLGYEDGENIPFETLLLIVERIKKSTSLPLTVDAEAGYSRNTEKVLENIDKLVRMGVSGINIEDSIVHSQRQLVDSDEFSQLLSRIKQQVSTQFFINVRTDTYLLNIKEVLSNTLSRIKQYENAGADGIFIPCLTNTQDINVICETTPLPVNLMSVPDLSNFQKLQALGVKRLSMGNFAFEKLQNQFATTLADVQKYQTFDGLF